MIPLNQIQVPKPCGEDWDAMDGDAQRRFCAGCGCHVHNLSAMTETQAQTVLDNAEGRVCVRFQTRSDGTVLTQDAAPPVVEYTTFWPRRLAAAASWALALALTGLGLTARAETAPHKTLPTKAKPHAATPAPKRPSVRLGRIVAPRQTEKPTGIRQGKPIVVPPPTPPIMGAVPVFTPPPAPTIMGGASPPPTNH